MGIFPWQLIFVGWVDGRKPNIYGLLWGCDCLRQPTKIIRRFIIYVDRFFYRNLEYANYSKRN